MILRCKRIILTSIVIRTAQSATPEVRIQGLEFRSQNSGVRGQEPELLYPLLGWI